MPPLLVLPFPNIDPIAIAVGPIAIRWYALAYVAGIVLGWWYARRLASDASLWGPGRRPTGGDIDDLIVWVALGIVLGGRIGYVLFYNFESYIEDPIEILTIWRGGMSFHGGLIGTLLATWLFSRSRGLRPLSVIDVSAVVTPIGLFTGRVANFVNGELWGRPAPDLPWAVVFPRAGDLPRHPSQLYEAATEGLVLFGVMAVSARLFGFRRPGLISGIFAIGYSLARIGCEVFREPDEQLGFLFGGAFSAVGGITMGQVLSLPLLAIGVFLVVRAARATAASPDERALA